MRLSRRNGRWFWVAETLPLLMRRVPWASFRLLAMKSQLPAVADQRVEAAGDEVGVDIAGDDGLFESL